MADVQSFASAVKAGDIATAKSLQLTLKKSLLSNPNFPPTSSNVSDTTSLTSARSILESSTLLAVATNDMSAFESNVNQLLVYYTDLAKTIPPSSLQDDILGMRLLYLLVENRMAEFHTSLELLTLSSSSAAIQYVLSLEQGMMEGSFGKVLEASAAAKLPSGHWKPLIDMLLKTVRENIASCLAVSMKSISKSDAKTLLFCQSDAELEDIATSFEWEKCNDGYVFSKPAARLTAMDIPSMRLVTESLTVATELDRIV